MLEIDAVLAQTCAACGKPMRMAGLIPRLGGHPEIRTFECRACRVVFSFEVKDEGRERVAPALSQA